MNGVAAGLATIGTPLGPDDGQRTALDLYDAALHATAAGCRPELTVGTDDQLWSTVDLASWSGEPRGADVSLLSRCTGPTLDVGCGPGRFTAAVAATGVAALGVDVSPAAVRLTRARGGVALPRSVFQRLPAEGRWQHVLLADGNIGIGGDPVRLLARCRDLLAATGTVLVELSAPGRTGGAVTVRLRHAGTQSAPFRWAYVTATEIAAVAGAAALQVAESWTEAGRWFAALARN